jgi:hypothetical protein
VVDAFDGQVEVLHPGRKDFTEDAPRFIDVEFVALLLGLHERSFPWPVPDASLF